MRSLTKRKQNLSVGYPARYPEASLFSDDCLSGTFRRQSLSKRPFFSPFFALSVAPESHSDEKSPLRRPGASRRARRAFSSSKLCELVAV